MLSTLMFSFKTYAEWTMVAVSIKGDKNYIDFDRIRKMMRLGYERNLNLPSSGFTAGPCLLKDTMQLSSFYKGNFNLGVSAMKINEGMVDLVIDKLKNS